MLLGKVLRYTDACSRSCLNRVMTWRGTVQWPQWPIYKEPLHACSVTERALRMRDGHDVLAAPVLT